MSDRSVGKPAGKRLEYLRLDRKMILKRILKYMVVRREIHNLTQDRERAVDTCDHVVTFRLYKKRQIS